MTQVRCMSKLHDMWPRPPCHPLLLHWYLSFSLCVWWLHVSGERGCSLWSLEGRGGEKSRACSQMGRLAGCKLGIDYCCTAVLFWVVLKNNSEENPPSGQSFGTAPRHSLCVEREVAQGKNTSETCTMARDLTCWPGAWEIKFGR